MCIGPRLKSQLVVVHYGVYNSGYGHCPVYKQNKNSLITINNHRYLLVVINNSGRIIGVASIFDCLRNFVCLQQSGASEK